MPSRAAPLLALAAWLLSASLASAEADYGGSRPAIDGTVPAVPNPLQLSFTEPLRSVVVTVSGPDPAVVVSLEPAHIVFPDGTSTTTPLRDAGPGRYQVTWSSVSDVDGSKASGSFSFFVVPETPVAPVPDVANPSLDPRLSTLSQRDAIRQRFRGQLDEALFNYLVGQGKSLDQALAAARRP